VPCFCFCRIYRYEYHAEIPREDLHALLDGIISLLESRAREVVKSALGFIKVAVVLLDANELAPHLAPMLAALVQWSGPAFRLKVRMIFERLIRKFDVETVTANTPAEHHKLIANIRRSKEREKKKKTARKVGGGSAMDEDSAPARSLTHKPSYDDLVNDSEDDDDGDEDDSGAAADGGNRRPGHLREGLDGDAVDLLDPSTGGRARSSGSAAAVPYKVDDDGRWVIPDEEDEVGGSGSGATAAADDGLTFGRGIHRDREPRAGFAASFGARKMKAKHARDDDGSDDEGDSAPKATHGVSRPAIGKAYRAKKAGGDVKLKNKPDPYAFVPFDAGRLNRRKRAKATGEFKGMMKAARKGASRGTANRKKT
jgi:ribosomal RNA-processing protein 12